MLLCALHLINQDTPLRNNQPRPCDAFFLLLRYFSVITSTGSQRSVVGAYSNIN